MVQRGQLDELARVGIPLIELMPVAEFDGRFGCGYDGVDRFAPSHLYGRPDDQRRLSMRRMPAASASCSTSSTTTSDRRATTCRRTA